MREDIRSTGPQLRVNFAWADCGFSCGMSFTLCEEVVHSRQTAVVFAPLRLEQCDSWQDRSGRGGTKVFSA